MTVQKFSVDAFARPLFSDRIAMAWTDPRAPMPRLMGDEVLAVEHVPAARAREFAAGRLAARKAMEMLGHIQRPVLQGPDRAPIWPPGLIGSITHSERDCLAVVSDDPEIRALGLDLDPAIPLDAATWPRVCTATEMAWLASLGPSQRGHFARLIRCAKEAVFKAQYALAPCSLDYHAITLSFDLGAGEFLARGCAESAGISGRFAILSDNFVAAVELSDRSRP